MAETLKLVIGLAVLAIITVKGWNIWSARLVDFVSWILNGFLYRRFTIRHVETRDHLPSASYRFPNGQGDAAKFLHGRENSLSWQNEFGSIYRIWSGMTPEIVLTKPDHIREVFKDSSQHIKAKNNDSGYFLGELLGKCVGLISQDEWKKLRGVTEQAFVRSTSITYCPLIWERTLRHFHDLRTGTSGLSRGIIDPALDLKMLPFWIMAEILYGRLTPEMERDLEQLAPAREALFKHVLVGNTTRYHWSKYLPTAANRELNWFKSAWESFNRRARDRLVFEKSDTSTADKPILSMYRAVNAGTVSEEAILHTLDEVLFANLDVTLGGISWNLVFLAAYPDVQARLRAEVAEKREAAMGDPAAFDRYVCDSTTYLAACVSESSRMRPLAAFSVPQATPTPRVLDGYLFPAGTNFVVDAYALNQRDPFWGKDGDRYRPDRFLREGGSIAAGSAAPGRYNFWRFGFGPRQCMGKFVADIVIRALLVHLVENYDLGILPEAGEGKEEDWARDPEVWINHPQMQLKCQARSSA
ncbi:cytochrome P450 monooxygenase [Apiospora arundinis]|uniref:Cytochrome P450 monooxygenase n=1 Tax=Apiospora arundinis TaxID=335852 RepID=A0ABR2I3S3_9PEZI